MSDYFLESAVGNGTAKEWTINKTGHNRSVGTTLVPISNGAIYPTPTSATTLRIKSGGNTNDTAAGTGAREITLIGLDSNGDLIRDTLATNGASASLATTKSFLRLIGIFVSASGTYGTTSSFSHAGEIVIENSSGGTNWAIIEATTAFDAQSEIGAITVPRGYTAYIKRFGFTVDTTKVTQIQVFKREQILQTSAPYTALRKIFGVIGASASGSITFDVPIVLPELTDLIAFGKVSSTTADVEITLDILFRLNE